MTDCYDSGSGDFEYEYEYSDDDDDNIDDNEDMVCSSTSSDSCSACVEEPIHNSLGKRVRESATTNSNGTHSSHNNAHNNTHLPSKTSAVSLRFAANTSAIAHTVPSHELWPLWHRRVADVAGALGVPPEAAAPLLRQFQWSTQRVLEAFMDNSERTLHQAGVAARCRGTRASRQGEVDCPICMDTVPSNEAMAMPCGHSFCLDCWGDYLVNTVSREGATCMTATCPEASCCERLTELEVQRAAPQLVAKYQHFALQQFAETVGRWCPGKGCDRVALPPTISSSVGETVAACDHCRSTFCFSCGDEPHSPVGCPNLQKWHTKGADESETINWLSANTKNCPKCSTRIEKNGGCMYITCRNCRHGFCWICMGTHHVSQCNAYNKEKDTHADERLRAKSELERYLHYFTRYQGHKEAQAYAMKQLDGEASTQQKQPLKKTATSAEAKRTGAGAKTPAKTEKPNNPNAGLDLPDFLKDANEQLIHCRRVLKYTYVFAFYHFVDNSQQKAKETFEFHQGILEGLTEDLSQATEVPLAEMDQQDVVNRTRAIGQFIKNVLAHVGDGMEED